MKTDPHFDIIIIGSGPAACAAALIFKSNDYSVAIVDNKENSTFPAGETLQADIKDLLLKLKFDESVLNEFHLPKYETASLWDSPLPVIKNSLFNPYGHGWYLDKRKFNQQLIDKCSNESIYHSCCNHVEIEHKDKGGWKIRCRLLQNYKVFSCAFLVDCSGRNRVLLRKLSIPIFKYDSLVAINAIFPILSSTPSLPDVIESAEHGWWYSSPLPDGKRIISFFADAKSTTFKNATKYWNFYHNLSCTHLLRSYTKCLDLRKPVPLRIRYANSEVTSSFFGSDWICAGDAAATFDPLSSQGIGTALRMGIEAASAVCDFIGNANTIKLEQFAKNYQHFFHDYLMQRKLYYSQVKKWPHSNFWINNTNYSISKHKT